MVFIAFEHCWKIHKHEETLIFRGIREEKFIIFISLYFTGRIRQDEKEEKKKHWRRSDDVVQTHSLVGYLWFRRNYFDQSLWLHKNNLKVCNKRNCNRYIQTEINKTTTTKIRRTFQIGENNKLWQHFTGGVHFAESMMVYERFEFLKGDNHSPWGEWVKTYRTLTDVFMTHIVRAQTNDEIMDCFYICGTVSAMNELQLCKWVDYFH